MAGPSMSLFATAAETSMTHTMRYSHAIAAHDHIHELFDTGSKWTVLTCESLGSNGAANNFLWDSPRLQKKCSDRCEQFSGML